MKPGRQQKQKNTLKSAVFLTIFWSLSAAMLYGFYRLFDVISITALIQRLLSA